MKNSTPPFFWYRIKVKKYYVTFWIDHYTKMYDMELVN